MMILHHGWRSSASRRVRLCLEEKGLSYQGHHVDMAAMEHHSPEYLKINPNGVIPTLIHDGRPLHESGTICEYLDERFPDSPLRPEGPYERAQMRNWIRHIDGLIGNLIIFNWRHHLQKTAQQWSDEELAAKLKNIPVLAVHGDADTTMDYETSKQMVELAKKAGVDATFIGVPGGSHTEAWTKVLPETFDFFDKNKTKKK